MPLGRGRRSRKSREGSSRYLIVIAIIIVIVMIVLAVANAESFPVGCGVEFAYAVNADTISLTLTSDSLIEHFYLAEHTSEPVQFIDCLLDGSLFVVLEEEEYGSVYGELFTKRFVITSLFNHLELRYHNPDINGKMNWVADIPAFGVITNIGSPVNIHWNE